MQIAFAGLAKLFLQQYKDAFRSRGIFPLAFRIIDNHPGFRSPGK
jgi:hypothetical protein